MRRGFEVRRDGRVVGELFEGAGPFISTAQTAGPSPIFPCAFVSSSERDEASIAGVLQAAKNIDDAHAALIEAGYTLGPIEDPERQLPIDTPRSPLRGFRG